ncbi:chemotaxis protein CheA [Sulfitobacter sp. HNIBRBA3233]|uniref:chemotaxis protein CheA n=1 Tax=Sulfitobacter marinivivus TaxID=3158558 RepID=UPI0032DFC87A
MINNNKILTVSYGTFSCTLEGFDDSFGTMKAIAEYFRDLAADDRYFGAEPPQPDAQMLARIAQREISRHVEARNDEGRIVLSAQRDDDARSESARAPAAAPALQHDAPAAVQDRVEQNATALATSEPDDAGDQYEEVQPAPAPAPEAVQDVPADAAPEAAAEHPASAPEIDVADAQEAATDNTEADQAAPAPDADADADIVPDLPDDKVEAFFADADLAEEAADDIADAAPEDQDAEEDARSAATMGSIAEKLKRIRAVVSRQESDEEADGYTEDEHAETPGAQSATARVEPTPVEETTAQSRADIVSATVRDIEDAFDADDMEYATDEGDSDSEEDDLAALLGRLDADAGDEEEDDAGLAAAADDAVDSAYEVDFSDSILASLDDEEDDEEEDDDFDARAEAEDDDALDDEYIADADVAQADAPQDGDDDDTDNILSALMEHDTDDTASDEAENRTTGENVFEDDTAPEAPAEPAAQAPRAPRTRVLKVKRATLEAAIEAGQLEEYDDEDDTAEEVAEAAAPSAAPSREVLRKAPLADRSTLSDEAEAELARELAELEAEIGGPAQAQHLASQDAGDHDAQFDDADDFADSREEAADEEDAFGGTAEPAEDDLSRLMDEAKSQMSEPESATRRDAFAHLRAAVAAKKADEAVGAAPSEDKSDEPYRDDLANVVRPRRPVAGAQRSERPPEPRPAPLKLVAEQRIDVDKPRLSGPVRPRRVAAVVDNTPTDTGTDAESFESFAEEMGAQGLSELLEAAAAYLSFVEGHQQFSRPQLMSKVRLVEQEEFTREDGLRSFGKLLREGKIEKIKGGRFQASEQIGFKPDNRVAG